MQLEINGKTYDFVFGYAFLKDVNEKYSTDVRGAKVRTGALRMMLAGIFDEDIQTIAEVLKIANNTESPKISESELAEYVADNLENEQEGIADKVLNELKKSKFTKKKVNEMVGVMNEQMN